MKIEGEVRKVVISPDRYICNLCGGDCTCTIHSGYFRLFGEYVGGKCLQIHLCPDCEESNFQLFLSKLKHPPEEFE